MDSSAVSTWRTERRVGQPHFRSQGRDILAAFCLIRPVTRIVVLSQVKIDFAWFLVGFRRQGCVDLVMSLNPKSSHLTVRGLRPQNGSQRYIERVGRI